jgi:mRNA interferase MazF
MKNSGPAKRWDLYWARLEPVVGSEQGGDRRPVLVLSSDRFNWAFELVTVVPLTRLEGKRRKVYPFEVVLSPEVLGTGPASIVMPQQIRTISRKRLLKRAGALRDPGKQGEIERRILEHLDIEFEAEFI